MLSKDRDGEWAWQNTGGRDVLSLDTSTRELGGQYDLCITGEVCDLVGSICHAVLGRRYTACSTGGGICRAVPGRRYMPCSTGEEVYAM